MNSNMYWLPYHRFYLETRLSPASIIQKAEKITEPYQRMRFGFLGAKKPYQGTVTPKQFNIIRILGYGNSYAPCITGTILESASDSKTKLCITMQLRKLVFIFSCLWFCSLILPLGILLWDTVSEPLSFLTKRGPFWATLVSMLLFGYAIVIFSFNLEAKKSKRFIIELLQAKEVSF